VAAQWKDEEPVTSEVLGSIPETQALIFEVSGHSAAPSLDYNWLAERAVHPLQHWKDCFTFITFKE
jgi:hypothetical protein